VNEHLMRALLYAALFFATCTDEECDPDLAVKQLESIAATLEGLTEAEQRELRSFANRLADEDPSAAVAAEIRRLIDGMLVGPDE
jgi:hypothetical protein